MTTTTATALIAHPGSACCDPTQDLAGWVKAETARLDRMDRWAIVLHQRGRRLHRLASHEWARCSHALGKQHDDESIAAHGIANSIATLAITARGHLERVVAAHQHRLGGTR